MRNGRKPTRKQKIRLGQAGLAPENWLVVRTKRTRRSSASAQRRTGSSTASSRISGTPGPARRPDGLSTRPGPISGRWRRRGRSQRARAQPSPPRSRRPAPPRPTRRSGRPSSTSTRSSSATGRRRRSTPWGWRWRRIARTTIAGSTSTSSTGPGSWTPPWTTWTRKALRRSPCGRRSGNGSESWRRCSTGTSPSSSIGRRRDHERVRPL